MRLQRDKGQTKAVILSVICLLSFLSFVLRPCSLIVQSPSSMILDRKHKAWLIATVVTSVLAFGIYLVLDVMLPEEPTGGSTVGLWYGVIGTMLLGIAGMLALVRRLPTWRFIGSRPAWLRAHLWLGTLSAVFLLCHSGFRCGGPLALMLSLATSGVIITGIAGLALQQVLPRWLAARVPCETPPGQLSGACRSLRRRADVLVDHACGPHDPRPGMPLAREQSPAEARSQLRAFYEQEVRPFLARRTELIGTSGSAMLSDPLQSAGLFTRLCGMSALEELRPYIEQLAALCQERRLLAEQERLQFWLHSWLLLHVPLSAALLVLLVAHVLSGLYF
jgi:hypothetical protein